MQRLRLAASVMFLGLCSESLLAAKATEDEMSLSALQAEVRSPDETVAAQAIEASRNFLQSKLLQAPDESIAATIVFRRGQSAAEIDSFTQKHKLEIARAEAKVPVGEDGTVFTMSVGARDLLLLEGPLTERLTKSSGNQQFRMMQAAPRASGAAKDRMLEVANTPVLLYYKIEAIGPSRQFSAIQKSSEVRAVLVDSTNSRLASYQLHKQAMAQAKQHGVPPIKGRRLEDGPPPGVPAARILQQQPR
jgi:hypothetical protein